MRLRCLTTCAPQGMTGVDIKVDDLGKFVHTPVFPTKLANDQGLLAALFCSVYDSLN